MKIQVGLTGPVGRDSLYDLVSGLGGHVRNDPFEDRYRGRILTWFVCMGVLLNVRPAFGPRASRAERCVPK